MREELKGCWTNQILLKLYTRRPHASPTSEFDLLDEEDQIQGGARETDGLTETAAGGNKILKIRSDPIHPLATKNLSKECQLLNLIPTLGGY